MDGARLRHWRLVRELTLRQLGARAGLNPTAISEMERGKREPHPSTIGKLARALEIETRELLSDPREALRDAVWEPAHGR